MNMGNRTAASLADPIDDDAGAVETTKLESSSWRRLASGRGEFGLRSLAPTVISRGLDQSLLGISSLLIARLVGTEAFAPFASLYIVYALAGQVADGGLAFAILRTPRGNAVSAASGWHRLGANLFIAIAATLVGFTLAGAAGTVVTAGGWIWLCGALSYVGRATLQWAGLELRLARAEAGSAAIFFGLVALLVRSSDDLLVFGLLLAGKSLLEFGLQAMPTQVFSPAGSTPAAASEWIGQMVTYSAANVDYLLIGLMVGPSALSVYAIAFRLASAFSSIVASPLTRSAFIQYTNSASLQAVNDLILRQVTVVGAAGVALTFIASPLLPVILGTGWEQTSELTLLLGMALPWRLLLGPTVAMGITTGRANSVIRWEMARLVLLAAAVAVFSFSILAVAAAVAGATIISVTVAHAVSAQGAKVTPPLRLFIGSGASVVLIGLTAALM